MKKLVPLAVAFVTMAALAVPAMAQTPPDDNIIWGGNSGIRVVRPLVLQTNLSFLLPGNPFTVVVKNILWGGGNDTTAAKNIIWGGITDEPSTKNIIWGGVTDAPSTKNIIWGG